MKQVREMAAAKKISVYVVLKQNKIIATVHVYFGSGRVMCDVWGKSGLIHQGSAGGYGYDKFTAALSGAVIEGIKIVDHCEARKKRPEGTDCFPANMKEPKGYRFANQRRDCYRISGLALLESFKMKVEQVL